MEKLIKTINMEEDEYYETHLSIINCILPVKLTPTEIKVLSKFMQLKGDIAKDRFGATARKQVKESLGLSSAGLSNYIGSLKHKKFIFENETETSILAILFPEENAQIYMFKFVNLGI